MSFRRDVGDAGRGLGLGAIVVIGATLITIVVLAIGTLGLGWFQQKSANFRGETSKRNQVEANGSYRIAAYDHFFDLCAHVQSDEQSITNLQQELRDKPAPTADRITQIQSSITALRNNRAETITQYNADSGKGYTEGQFKSSNLPFQLDPTTKETSCTAA